MSDVSISKDGKIHDKNGIVHTWHQKYGLRGKYYEVCQYGAVHRLVAELYVLNVDPLTKTEVHHIDENTKNNHYTNLMWVTHDENNKLNRCYNEYTIFNGNNVYITQNLLCFCEEFKLDVGALRKTSDDTKAKDKRKQHKGFLIYSKKFLNLNDRDLKNLSCPYVKIMSKFDYEQ